MRELMEFKKYQHIERFGRTEVEGILNGTVHIFDKIDGTNAQVWLGEDGMLHFGSRNREISLDFDNHGFMNSLRNNKNLIDFFSENKCLRLFGEWLKPHTIKYYEDNAWANFYVFDVMDDNDKYLPYEEYVELLEKHNILYIPALAVLNNPTYEDITSYLNKVKFLVKEGCGMGEGIVIKNYQYTNKFGNKIWAKIVLEEFKSSHKSNKIKQKYDSDLVEERIVEKYITKSFVEKEYAKLFVDGVFDNKSIPRLLNTIFYSLIAEDAWDFVKEFKKPTVNFKTLEFLCRERVKSFLPMVF